MLRGSPATSVSSVPTAHRIVQVSAGPNSRAPRPREVGANYVTILPWLVAPLSQRPRPLSVPQGPGLGHGTPRMSGRGSAPGSHQVTDVPGEGGVLARCWWGFCTVPPFGDQHGASSKSETLPHLGVQLPPVGIRPEDRRGPGAGTLLHYSQQPEGAAPCLWAEQWVRELGWSALGTTECGSALQRGATLAADRPGGRCTQWHRLVTEGQALRGPTYGRPPGGVASRETGGTQASGGRGRGEQ